MWVSAVARTILAGVIAEMLVQPRGAGKRARLPALWRPAAGFVAFVLAAARSSRGVVLLRNRDAHREVVVGLMRRNCGAAAKG
jgi:hypothetical protein